MLRANRLALLPTNLLSTFRYNYYNHTLAYLFNISQGCIAGILGPLFSDLCVYGISIRKCAKKKCFDIIHYYFTMKESRPVHVVFIHNMY